MLKCGYQTVSSSEGCCIRTHSSSTGALPISIRARVISVYVTALTDCRWASPPRLVRRDRRKLHSSAGGHHFRDENDVFALIHQVPGRGTESLCIQSLCLSGVLETWAIVHSKRRALQ